MLILKNFSVSDGRFETVYKMNSPVIPKRERFVTRFDHLYPEFEVSFDFKILDPGPVSWRSLFRLSRNSVQSDRDKLVESFSTDAVSLIRWERPSWPYFRGNQDRNCGSQMPAFFYRTFYNKTVDRHVPTVLIRSCINKEKSKPIKLPEIQNPANFTRITYKQVLENNTFYVKIGKIIRF